MSNYRRSYCQAGTYFFTVVAYDRRPIFCEPIFRTALRNAIKETQLELPFDIDAWVLLPDHLHCIWTLPSNDDNFSIRWAKIKRNVTKQCSCLHSQQLMTPSKYKRKESTLWQRRFWEHQIRSEQDFAHHADYIHYNPVKHGYVKQVADWQYSTFHRYVKQGFYPQNWSCNLVEQLSIHPGE
jgi:putative transposase